MLEVGGLTLAVLTSLDHHVTSLGSFSFSGYFQLLPSTLPLT